MTTLFSQITEPRRDPLSLAISALMHGVLFALLFFGLVQAPLATRPPLKKPAKMRTVEMHMPDFPVPRPVPADKTNSPRRSNALAQSRGASSAGHAPMAVPDTPATPALQTLIQSDVPPAPQLPRPLPVPLLVLRSPQPLPNPKIAPPPPQENFAAEIRASVQPPNRESTLADIAINSTAFESQKLPVLPTTTTAVTVHGPELKQETPQTTSKLSTEPATATVTSLSDLRMNEGTVVLPPVNEKSPAPPAAGLSSDPHEAAKAGSAPEKDKVSPKTISTETAGSGPHALGKPGESSGHGAGGDPSVKRIILPKDGKFPIVTIGNSFDEEYPETAGIWSGRLSYTVYLHVGQPKNWILQYSIPRAKLDAGTGSSARLEAPWPTDILVPSLPPGSVNSDALVVHGMLDANGRFQQMAVVFPPDFEQAGYLVDTLQHWIFRPAAQNGLNTGVEVLLIIPESTD